MNLSHLPAARERARSGAWSSLRVRDPETARLDLFPDFLILGPQRTGTTWLYHNLKKHPQISLPRTKETYYFSTLGRPGHARFEFEWLDDFLETHLRERFRQRVKRHYDSLRHCREWYRPLVRGEATATNALIQAHTIAELVSVNPDLKAVLMLRDPIGRAWSHARKDLVRKQGLRPEEVSAEDYAKFFRASGQRGLADYAALLRTWTTALKPGHVFVGDFEMIAETPGDLLTGLHRFLGVRSGDRYFNRHLEERINPAATGQGGGEGGMPEAAREKLAELLREEAAQYQDLRALLRAGQGGPAAAAIRERHGIGPITCPARPIAAGAEAAD